MLSRGRAKRGHKLHEDNHMGTLKLPFRSQFITFLKKIIQEISKHISIINASYEGICVELKRKTTQH